MAINIDQMAKEINRQLQQYANGVGEGIEQVAKKVAQDGVKRLKASSPDLTGSYRTGWRAKKVDSTWTVYNATDYQLTHLLENGHAKIGGGRVTAKVHIKPVEEQMIDDFVREVEGVVRG